MYVSISVVTTSVFLCVQLQYVRFQYVKSDASTQTFAVSQAHTQSMPWRKKIKNNPLYPFIHCELQMAMQLWQCHRYWRAMRPWGKDNVHKSCICVRNFFKGLPSKPEHMCIYVKDRESRTFVHIGDVNKPQSQFISIQRYKCVGLLLIEYSATINVRDWKTAQSLGTGNIQLVGEQPSLLFPPVSWLIRDLIRMWPYSWVWNIPTFCPPPPLPWHPLSNTSPPPYTPSPSLLPNEVYLWHLRWKNSL